ncbi:hypothetical protein SANTM175S_04889 [Streptomyces antimycoticus]
MAVHKQRNARRLGLAVAAATAVTAGVFVAVPAGATTAKPAEGTVYGTQSKSAVDGRWQSRCQDLASAFQLAAHCVEIQVDGEFSGDVDGSLARDSGSLAVGVPLQFVHHHAPDLASSRPANRRAPSHGRRERA